MNITSLPLKETGFFAKTLCDYLDNSPSLEPFHNGVPSIDKFEDLLNDYDVDRKTLVNSLKRQYQHIDIRPEFQIQLEMLEASTTFTVTTGHQLNIFTGPLYFIYKIVTTINLAHQLKKAYPDHHFVPVYWMASEDHDFDEISYFRLFGKIHEWKTNQEGAVGRFKTDEISEILSHLPEPVPVFETAYANAANLADAVRSYVHELFSEYGLVVIDGDDVDLKRSFAHHVKKELFDNLSNSHVQKTSQKLEASGYKPQVFSREINLFYLTSNARKRIERSGDYFEIIGSDLKFTEGQILKELNDHPERFSPNVITRPAYQQTILPNLAYIGGPAEIAYWFQLKEYFSNTGITFPLLVPRNFALVISATQQNKLEKLSLQISDLFTSDQDLKRLVLDRFGVEEIDFTKEKNAIKDTYDSMTSLATSIDKSLEGYIQADFHRVIKQVDNIERKTQKSLDSKHEVSLNQVRKLKDALFPNGGLQERIDNFMNFYLNDPSFISNLIETLDPLDFQFHILAND